MENNKKFKQKRDDKMSEPLQRSRNREEKNINYMTQIMK